MEKLIGEYSVVEIPEGAERFSFGYDSRNWLYYYKKNSANSFDHRHIELPPGNYELIGISDDLNDEQLKEIIVEQTLNHYTGKLMGWKNYGNEGWEYLDTRRESFNSLLASKGLKGRYAILKQLK